MAILPTRNEELPASRLLHPSGQVPSHFDAEPGAEPAALGREFADAYLRRSFPRLVPRAHIDTLPLESLLQRSGYLELRQGDCTFAEWQRFCEGYSFDFVYRAEGGELLGHASSTRIYSSTWLGHQLATLGGHAESGVCRSELYAFLSVAPRLVDGERAHSIAYFNPSRRWHQLFFQQFSDGVQDPTLTAIGLWDRFERDSGAPDLPARWPRGPRIEALQKSDLSLAVALVRSQLPGLLADAMDIFPEALQATRLNGDAARTRTAFGVYLERELAGVALCEFGPSNASLFNLLNLAQFYFPAPAPTPSGGLEAQLALLGAVRSFYRTQGIEHPVVVAPPHSFAAEREPGTRLGERMGCIAWSCGGLVRYEDYCRVQMERLYRRKGASRKGAANVQGSD